MGNLTPGWIALRISLLSCWLALTALALPAQAATASELLEKAIYAEETVGDLDEAIKIYEQVLAAGKKAEKAAAEAQLRIGLCHAKQGHTEKAMAAFQAVVDNFPGVTEIVAQAKRQLPQDAQLLPPPWQDNEELQLEMKLATGLGVGTQIYRIEKSEREGRSVWECSAWQVITINGQGGHSHVVVDAESFAPIASQWQHSLLGKATATYGEDQVEIQIVNKEPIQLTLTEQAYDNEQGAELFRLLPLKAGYKTKLTIVSILTGMKVPLGVEVTRVENVKVPAGEFECFRLTLDIGQTFWISNDDHRYIVKFEAGGVSAELTSIRHRQADESQPLQTARFDLTLPAGWHAYTPTKLSEPENTTTSLIDPQAIMNVRVEADPLAPIQSKHATAQEWLQASLDKYSTQMPEFALHGDGIKQIVIDGRTAYAAVFDFVEGGQPKTAGRGVVYSDSSAVNVRFTMPRESYEASQASLHEVLSGLRVH